MSARTSADRISNARANETRLFLIELLMPFQYGVKLYTDTDLPNKVPDTIIKMSCVKIQHKTVDGELVSNTPDSFCDTNIWKEMQRSQN